MHHANPPPKYRFYILDAEAACSETVGCCERPANPSSPPQAEAVRVATHQEGITASASRPYLKRLFASQLVNTEGANGRPRAGAGIISISASGHYWTCLCWLHVYADHVSADQANGRCMANARITRIPC